MLRECTARFLQGGNERTSTTSESDALGVTLRIFRASTSPNPLTARRALPAAAPAAACPPSVAGVAKYISVVLQIFRKAEPQRPVLRRGRRGIAKQEGAKKVGRCLLFKAAWYASRKWRPSTPLPMTMRFAKRRANGAPMAPRPNPIPKPRPITSEKSHGARRARKPCFSGTWRPFHSTV